MATYPTLYINPDAQGSAIDFGSIDTVVRFRTEDGSVKIRRKFTGELEVFPLRYSNMSNSDKETLEAFYKTELSMGEGDFTFTHWDTSTVYNAVFLGKPKFSRSRSNDGTWNVSMILKRKDLT